MLVLKTAWRGWKAFAFWIGNLQARLILGIFYFTLVALVALPVKMVDPLRIRRKRPGWTAHRPQTTVQDLRKQG